MPEVRQTVVVLIDLAEINDSMNNFILLSPSHTRTHLHTHKTTLMHTHIIIKSRTLSFQIITRFRIKHKLRESMW